MDSTKIAIAHVAGELVIVGGLSFYFNKKITLLQNEIEELKKKIELLEKNDEEDGGGLTPEQLESLTKFQTQTTNHINNLYSVLKQIAENQQSHQLPPSQPQVFTAPKKKKNLTAEITTSKVIRTPSQVVFATETVSNVPVSKKKKSTAVIEEVIEEENINEEEQLDRELEEELNDLKKPSEDEEQEDEEQTDIKDEVSNTEDDSSEQTEIEFVAPPPKKKKVVKKKTPAK